MPSATGQSRQEYHDFRGGDYGSGDGSKVAPNTFRAMNMIVTSDGCLIPRPGLRDHSPTGMPTGKVVGLAPTSTPNRDMLFIVGNKVYTYKKSDGSGLTEIGTLDTTPTKALYPKQGTTEFYITIPGDKTYKLDPVTNTIDPYSSSPGGTEVELLGQRLIVAGADEPYRIQFSAPADFDSWPAENFIDIGDFWQISAMREQRNYLTIMKPRGIYMLSGVPGTSSAGVRRISKERGPLHPGQTAVDFSEMIHFLSAFHQNPATFDSVGVEQLSYLDELAAVRDDETPNLPIVIGTANSQGKLTPSTVLFTQGGDANKMLLNHNGAWTRHETSVDITGMVRGGETGDFYVTDGGAVGVAGKIYSVQFIDDRPALTTDGFTQPGDASDTPVDAWVTFPQFWVPMSRRTTGATEVKVRQVIVDFWKYNTGSSSHNHIDIALDVYGRPGGIGDASTNTYAWDEAGSVAGASTGDFRRDRIVHGLEAAKGAGFELTLRNIRGVKIRQVTVVYDIDDTRPTH